MAYKTETPKWMKRLVRARMKETGEKYTKTLRDIKAEVEDERKPGEAFCSDCPDHEACMTNYPCSMVKRVDKENLDARSGEH